MMTQADGHAQEEGVEGQVHKVPCQNGDGPGQDRREGKGPGIFPLSHRAPHRGRKTTAPPQAHGEEAEVVDHSSRHQDGHHGSRNRMPRMVPRVTRRLVRESPLTRALFREKMSVTRMEAIPKARPEPPPHHSDEQGPQHHPAEEGGHKPGHKHRKDLGSGLNLDEPLWYALSHGLEGGHLVGSDAVAPHIQADEDAGDADGRDEAGTEEGALLGGPVTLPPTRWPGHRSGWTAPPSTRDRPEPMSLEAPGR